MDKFYNQIDDIIMNGNYESSFLSVQLNSEIDNQLYDYQFMQVQSMINCINKYNIVLDTSDTGTGKTYCAMAVCNQLGLTPIVLCPKTIITKWKKVAMLFNVEPLFICNYESIKKGKYYENNNRVKCPYIEYIDEQYFWNLPNGNHIFIFDEVHYCRNKQSLNGKLLISTYDYPKMLLSATIIDSIKTFELITYMLKWCEFSQMRSYLSAETNKMKSLKYLKNKLYPEYATRISIKELGDRFPKNNIIIETFDGKKNYLIDEQYENHLVEILKKRQQIEQYKTNIIVELTKQYLENHFSVVIFVNFKKTLQQLCELLKTKCSIHGDQTMRLRHKNILKFQKNKERIIICNINAGGQSIDLHDTDGKYPRVSIISPGLSATQLIQALGRIHRVESKSPATQIIVYCSNTIEEQICNKLQNKIHDLENLNDDDLYQTIIV